MAKQFNLFGLVRKLVKLLLVSNKSERVEHISALEGLISHLEKILKTRGVVFLFKYVKGTRLNLLNYFSGNPVRDDICALTKDGIPISLGSYIKSIRKKSISTFELRLILTILFSTRALKGKVEPDLNSIVGPSKRSESTIHDTGFAKLFWRELGYIHPGVLPRLLRFRRFHFSTKSGPHGHALGSWFIDLINLPYQLVCDIKELGGPKMEEILDKWTWILHIYKFVPSFLKRNYCRKIVSFSDKEGKTRTIAILDYWSQTVLKGLHQYLFRVLKKIPQDCTFDQGSFIQKSKSWEIFYSVDLSSATDRFPIDFISGVLEGHLPSSYVRAWRRVMVGLPFRVNNTDINYSVGNPMGAYSSWASFALAHHYVIWLICMRLDIPWKEAKYVLLGDDIVIGDKRIGEAYLAYIKLLGVDYSPAKTHVSDKLYEFAKRWIFDGAEISPFPVSALKQSGKKWYNLLTLFAEQNLRGWNFELGVPGIVSSYYGIVLNRPSRYKKDMLKKCILGEQILLHIWGLQGAHISLTEIVRYLKIPNIFQPINEYTANSIFINTVVNIFSESDPTKSDKAKGQPLGWLATELVMEATSQCEEISNLLLESPVLHAYGSIEQAYLDLLKKAREIDTVGKGEWPLVLRSMGIPLSDRVFIDRFTLTESNSSAKLMKGVVENLEMLSQFPDFQGM